MWLPLLGLVVGLLAGWRLSPEISFIYAHYFVVLLFVILDAVSGGFKAGLNDEFDTGLFWLGLATNLIPALLLVFLGERLGVDLYFVVLFVFSYRIFRDVSFIRRLLLEKHKRLEKREN